MGIISGSIFSSSWVGITTTYVEAVSGKMKIILHQSWSGGKSNINKETVIALDIDEV